MPKSIVQSNSGDRAVQIGQVHGDVTIIQVSHPPDGSFSLRETSLALGAFSLLFIGITVATPDLFVQVVSYLIGSMLGGLSVFKLCRSTLE